MKNYFISTFAAIALALPLGIGGLTIAAPVTATDAEGFELILSTVTEQPFRYGTRWNTCSTETIWRCDKKVHRSILFDPRYFKIFEVDPLPDGANGADQATYERLIQFIEIDWNGPRAFPVIKLCCGAGEIDLDPGTGRGSWRDDLSAYLKQFYSDEDVKAYNETADEPFVIERDQVGEEYDVPYYYRDGHISPRELARFREFVQAAEVEAERPLSERNTDKKRETYTRFVNDCQYHNGELKEAAENEPATCGILIHQSEEANVYKVTEYTGYDPAKPNVYSKRRGILRTPPNVSYVDYEDDGSTGLQVTQVSPVTLADLNNADDPETATRERVVENRGTIIDLVDNVNENESRLFALEPVVEANSRLIENLGNSLSTLASEVAALSDNVEENRAGVALALAIPRSGLQYEETFRLSAGVGNFKGESALGVGLEFRISPRVSTSVGGGLSQHGSSGVRAEISYGW